MIFISKTNLDYLHTDQARYGHNLPVCLLRSRTEPILASFVASLPQRASPLGLVVNSCDRNTRERKRERERKGFSYPSHDSTSYVSMVTVVLSSTKQSIPSSHHPIIPLIIPSSSHHFLKSQLPHLYSVLPDGISDSLPFGKAKRVEKEKIDITMHRITFTFLCAAAGMN